MRSFGKPTFRAADFTVKTESSYGWSKTFTGQVYDVETGLMLYRNRYYHPNLGRFITRDPIGYRGKDHNLYRHVHNEVVSHRDANGLIDDMTIINSRYPLQKERCDTVSLYDDNDQTKGDDIAGSHDFECMAYALGNPVPMLGRGMQAVSQYTKPRGCCISKFNLIDHGGGGVQQAGMNPLSIEDAVTLCESLCPNATVTLYGCNSGNPETGLQGVRRLLQVCSKIKVVTACTTIVNFPLTDSQRCCRKDPPNSGHIPPKGVCYETITHPDGSEEFHNAWATYDKNYFWK